jgi:hypothetical protein
LGEEKERKKKSGDVLIGVRKKKEIKKEKKRTNFYSFLKI